MKSKNKKIRQQYGLTDEGAALADKLMPRMLQLVKELNFDKYLLYIVLEEAAFQVRELPNRTKKFQKENTWKVTNEKDTMR
jgi:hypothetical protein